MCKEQVISFINKLNNDSILDLTNLWFKENNINDKRFNHFIYQDIIYLKDCFYKSQKIQQFFKYYKTLPVDIQDEKYINSIIYHYNTIYSDYLLYL